MESFSGAAADLGDEGALLISAAAFLHARAAVHRVEPILHRHHPRSAAGWQVKNGCSGYSERKAEHLRGGAAAMR